MNEVSVKREDCNAWQEYPSEQPEQPPNNKNMPVGVQCKILESLFRKSKCVLKLFCNINLNSGLLIFFYYMFACINNDFAPPLLFRTKKAGYYRSTSVWHQPNHTMSENIRWSSVTSDVWWKWWRIVFCVRMHSELFTFPYCYLSWHLSQLAHLWNKWGKFPSVDPELITQIFQSFLSYMHNIAHIWKLMVIVTLSPQIMLN